MQRLFVDSELFLFLETSSSEFYTKIKDVASLTDGLQLQSGWAAFLNFLGLSPAFEGMAPFTAETPLFSVAIQALNQQVPQDFLIRVYDQIFVDCLTQVKALPFVNAAFLLERLDDVLHERSSGNSWIAQWALRYKERLTSETSNALHDLTLFLAWDRMCVRCASLFDFHHQDFLPGELTVFKDCLIESFQHIWAQKRTTPSFYRLMEALYSFYMRDEKLQDYPEDIWQTLCQAATTLKSRDNPYDISYLDNAFSIAEKAPGEEAFALTLASPEKVRASLKFASYVLSAESLSAASWYLLPQKIICVDAETRVPFLLVDQ